MTSFIDLLEELGQAKKAGNRGQCLALCEKGIAMASSGPDLYCFRINKARFLLGLDFNDTKLSSEDVEDAIQVYLDILVDATEVKERENSCVGLGWAYYLKIKGDRKHNLRQAIAYYQEAVNLYELPARAYAWATAKAAIGLCFEEIANDATMLALGDAIQNYEEALSVFTQQEHPEDWKETNEKLTRLKLRLPTGYRC